MASSPGCEPGLVETRPGGSSRERPEHESEEVVDLTADSPLAEVCLVEDDELEAIDVAMKAAESYWSRKKEVLDASPPTQCKWNMPRLEGRKDSSSKGAAECKKHSMADVAERPRKRPGADRTGKIAKARSILAKSDSSFLERVDRLRAEGGRGGSSCTGDMNGEGPPEVEESLSGGRSIAGGQDVVASVEESLDPQQQAVLDSVLNGNNVFFSGMGGTGKTFLLKRIVAALKKVHGTKAVACCAPTGVAAILCGGQTLHSLAGCGIANTARDFDKLWKDVNKKKWRLLRALVVDEVSMIDPSFLDFLDLQVRQVRGDLEKPFGGLQLVLCGDFCQLPGITKGLSFSDVHLIPTGEDMNEKNIPVGRLEELMGAAFQTNFWRDAAFCYHVLETAHRQSDQAFVDFLAKVRFNRMDEDSERFMGRLSRCLPASDIVPTQLYARNREVDQENQRELARLPGPDVFYEAIDGVAVMPGAPAWAKADLEKNVFFRESVTPKRLVLRVGAQVMLTRNDQNDKSLVNGSRGVVRGFEDKQTALASVRQELKLLRGVGGRSAGEAPEAMAAREAELVSRLAALESGREAEYPLVWFEGAGVGGAGRLKIVGPEPFECEVYMTGLVSGVPARLGSDFSSPACTRAQPLCSFGRTLVVIHGLSRSFVFVRCLRFCLAAF